MSEDGYQLRIQKNHLWSLIKKIGEHWGEEREFLREYGGEIFNANEKDLPRAIECFKSLAEQCRWIGSKDFKT